LALGLLTVPLHIPIVDPSTPALADDDDDDGGGGGGGGRGGGGGGRADGGRDRDEVGPRTQRPRAAKPVQRRSSQQASRPTIVALDLSEQALAEARRRGFSRISSDNLRSIGISVHRLRAPARLSTAQAKALLVELGAAGADPNTIYRPQSESVCQDNACDELQLVGWRSVEARACDGDYMIGMIETHVDKAHPSLSPGALEVIDLRPKGTRQSSQAHGTAVATLLAGSPQGILPSAKVLAAVPYYRSPKGDDIAQAYDVVRAIDVLVSRSPDVINMSLTGPQNAAIELALKRAHEKGIAIVAAAGNAGAKARPLYPAAYATTVAVTAVSTSLKIYRRASQGDHVDFAAPGVDVELMNAKGKLEKISGTSFAAPHVSAAMAILRKKEPQASIDSLVSRLASAARDLGAPGRDKVFGWGLLQAGDLCQSN
jgi:subtilisin family serine protease